MTVARSRTRDDVVRAASRLFAARGYHGTSMRDLAREVGVLGSSLYSHIDSKEDLLVEIVEIGAALFQSAAEQAIKQGGTGADQLAALVEGHIDVVLDHLDEARTFLYEANALDRRAPRQGPRRAGSVRGGVPSRFPNRGCRRFVSIRYRHQARGDPGAFHPQRHRAVVSARR